MPRFIAHASHAPRRPPPVWFRMTAIALCFAAAFALGRIFFPAEITPGRLVLAAVFGATGIYCWDETAGWDWFT